MDGPLSGRPWVCSRGWPGFMSLPPSLYCSLEDSTLTTPGIAEWGILESGTTIRILQRESGEGRSLPQFTQTPCILLRSGSSCNPASSNRGTDPRTQIIRCGEKAFWNIGTSLKPKVISSSHIHHNKLQPGTRETGKESGFVLLRFPYLLASLHWCL